jgi:hypothetical protein
MCIDPLSLQSPVGKLVMKEAQHPSHIVNGGKVPNNEDNTISEDERSNQVAEDKTLLDFREDGAKMKLKSKTKKLKH